MITAVIVIAVIAYAGSHLGAGHTHHRYRKAHGLRPNFYSSSLRGPYASIRLPGGCSSAAVGLRVVVEVVPPLNPPLRSRDLGTPRAAPPVRMRFTAPRGVRGPSTPGESESTCASRVPLIRLLRQGQYGQMADRYLTPGGWTIEVVHLAEGERLRIRHYGYYIADVRDLLDGGGHVPLPDEQLARGVVNRAYCKRAVGTTASLVLPACG
jgi:hypothetical protein